MKYYNDKTRTITVRLTEKQYAYLQGTSDAYGIKPSDFLRLVVDQAMYREIKGKGIDEDITTNYNDKF